MLVQVRASTNCPQQGVEDCGEFLKVRAKSKPLEGKANAEIISLVAKHFGVSASKVSIVRGSSSKKKVLEIADAY